MKHALIASAIMLSVTQYAAADTGSMAVGDAYKLPSESKKLMATAPGGEILSDDFMRDVSDGSSAGEGGDHGQEESGETIEQTLRMNTKSANH